MPNPTNKTRTNNDDIKVKLAQNDPAWSSQYRRVKGLQLSVSTV